MSRVLEKALVPHFMVGKRWYLSMLYRKHFDIPFSTNLLRHSVSEMGL